ncbi:hypothetical protein CKM354_000057700 [Cercospora kikuchii]|uniref:Atos-like conserved domain-containing protein n=1 Tax=Cercospora kikuchii TaxID=84275 RepID=A0A9P3C985_9PEZI|nr:uncharacterized protein CKM354_000057700 [Cercospora kikuchii]GIZ37117.1 hypothetical protein CKM354_000057700 [Cercospora kikuchii]
MAVNNGCPGCQPQPGQMSSRSSGEQERSSTVKARAVSPDNGTANPNIFNPYYTGRPRTPANGSKSSTLDRQELIRRIKSGSRPSSPELERPASSEYSRIIRIKSRESRPTSPEPERPVSSGLEWKRRSPVPFSSLANAQDVRPNSPEPQQDNLALGLQIERPRSALHRGDFREQSQPSEQFNAQTPIKEESHTVLSTSPVVPWHPAFPATYRPLRREQDETRAEHAIPIPRPERHRTVSNASLAANFVYKPPTSPLVQSSRPDTPEPPTSEDPRSPEKSRRHTFSPRSFNHFQSALNYPTVARVAPPLRSEKSFPYQALQPSRSVNPTSPYASLPHTPRVGQRRPSVSELPLLHAPLVGSYEESILRGRMSTTPSKPLNFMAQIGVLGKGNCKSNLRCPPHVQIPFPAVFYSYGAASKTPAIDQPSPYVGLVDLENGLPSAEQPRDRRRERVQASHSNNGSRASSPNGSGPDTATRRRRTKQKRRSGSPRAPPGGSYRIPQQGQLQIVLKNPNKTAVKLFLVPYDLSDMEPGQKTFIRQRSYSAGPIIDMPLTSRANYGTDRPEAALSPTGDPNDKPMLRYLIHLHICCPSKGRFFLYKSVRVVFANRVPDGKEKLRNEIQMPEPRYSAYKAGRESNVGSTTCTPAQDNARRRSALDPAITESRWAPPPYIAQSMPNTEPTAQQQYDVPTPTLPRQFTTLPTLLSRPSSRSFSDNMDLDSGSQGTRSPLSPASTQGDEMRRSIPKLDDPFTFERDRSRERRSGNGNNESLIARRLMDLAFQKQRGL